jgi:hypothetical protein
MYVFGGRGFGGSYLTMDKVLMLNTNTYVWEEKHAGGDVPTPRFLHTTTSTCLVVRCVVCCGRALTCRRRVLRSALKLLNGLYLFGGEHNNEALSDLYVFNPGTLKTILLPSLLLIHYRDMHI